MGGFTITHSIILGKPETGIYFGRECNQDERHYVELEVEFGKPAQICEEDSEVYLNDPSKIDGTVPLSDVSDPYGNVDSNLFFFLKNL